MDDDFEPFERDFSDMDEQGFRPLELLPEEEQEEDEFYDEPVDPDFNPELEVLLIERGPDLVDFEDE